MEVFRDYAPLWKKVIAQYDLYGKDCTVTRRSCWVTEVIARGPIKSITVTDEEKVVIEFQWQARLRKDQTWEITGRTTITFRAHPVLPNTTSGGFIKFEYSEPEVIGIISLEPQVQLDPAAVIGLNLESV